MNVLDVFTIIQPESFSTIISIYINLYLLSSKTEGSARKTHFPDCDPSLIPAMAWQIMFRNHQ